MNTVTIIGVGRVGGALALALASHGYVVNQLVVRDDTTAERVASKINPPPRIVTIGDIGRIDDQLVLIATQDGEIANVASNLAAHIQTGTDVIHVSGSLSSTVLDPLRKRGASVGSLHPLISVSDAELGQQRLAGAMFCVEGDEGAVLAAKNIVDALGGECFSIDTEFKSLYHAAAVTACGHMVALIDVSVEMLNKCGVDESAAQRMLLPLIRSTIENVSGQTLSNALTGPFARGDSDTIGVHLASIEKNVDEDIREIYLVLAARSLRLAAQRGVKAETMVEIAKKISLAKKNLRC
jgi:predicted short-subunit dehydrogenase-like oxidoreductase (DUF2520 family)